MRYEPSVSSAICLRALMSCCSSLRARLAAQELLPEAGEHAERDADAAEQHQHAGRGDERARPAALRLLLVVVVGTRPPAGRLRRRSRAAGLGRLRRATLRTPRATTPLERDVDVSALGATSSVSAFGAGSSGVSTLGATTSMLSSSSAGGPPCVAERAGRRHQIVRIGRVERDADLRRALLGRQQIRFVLVDSRSAAARCRPARLRRRQIDDVAARRVDGRRQIDVVGPRPARRVIDESRSSAPAASAAASRGGAIAAAAAAIGGGLGGAIDVPRATPTSAPAARASIISLGAGRSISSGPGAIMPGAASGSGVGPSSSPKLDSSISRGFGGGGGGSGTGGLGIAGAVEPPPRSHRELVQAGRALHRHPRRRNPVLVEVVLGAAALAGDFHGRSRAKSYHAPSWRPGRIRFTT